MHKNIDYDYKNYYDSVLVTKDEMGIVMAAELINFLSDLILKYNEEIEIRNRDTEGKYKWKG